MLTKFEVLSATLGSGLVIPVTFSASAGEGVSTMGRGREVLDALSQVLSEPVHSVHVVCGMSSLMAGWWLSFRVAWVLGLDG